MKMLGNIPVLVTKVPGQVYVVGRESIQKRDVIKPMTNNNLEPAAFIFPLPPELREQYINWSKKYPHNLTGGKHESSDGPILIPVYPAFPGMMPYPANSNCGSGFNARPGVNPFVLFLILILLVFAFKKEQIVEAIKKMLK